MKKLFLYGACALLSLGAVSCHGDDPLMPPTPTPVVNNTTKTISGVVYDNEGKPVAGATVTCGDRTTTTDANGAYSFDNVTPGNHTVTVSKDGSETTSSDVTVPDGDNAYNATTSFTVFPEVSSAKVKDGESTTIKTLSTPGNTMSVTNITLSTEDNTLPEDVEIWITPVYSDLSDNVTRASVLEFLLGATIQTSKPVTLSKDVTIKFDLDPSVTAVASYQEFLNDAWSGLNATVNNGEVVIKTRDIATFGIFAPVDITSTQAKQAISFTKDLWDNFNGTSAMKIDKADFTYRTGFSVETTAANKLQGLLIDLLARKFGAKVATEKGSYDVNLNLPAGYGFKMYGDQYLYRVSAVSKNTTVKGTRYDNVELWNKIWNTDHNGGGSVH